MANRKAVTVERVLEMIREHGPIEQKEISRRFRGRLAYGKDRIRLQVSSAILQLHEERKIIPTKINTNITTWNSI